MDFDPERRPDDAAVAPRDRALGNDDVGGRIPADHELGSDAELVPSALTPPENDLKRPHLVTRGYCAARGGCGKHHSGS